MNDQIPEHLRKLATAISVGIYGETNAAVTEVGQRLMAQALHAATAPLVEALEYLELLGLQCCDGSHYGSVGEHDTSCSVFKALAPYRQVEKQEAS